MSMFKPGGKIEAGAGDTVIAPGVKVEGDFHSAGNIVIEGEVVGTLKTLMDLMVGTDARIAANVSARNAKISGEIRGNLSVEDRVDLSSTAKIFGDIQAKVLTMEPGACVNGRCMMGEAQGEVAREGESDAARSVAGSVLAQQRVLKASRLSR